MLLFKSCPRCQGDMHTNRDFYGEYKECLQCGLMVDIEKSRDMLASDVVKVGKKKEASGLGVGRKSWPLEALKKTPGPLPREGQVFSSCLGDGLDILGYRAAARPVVGWR